MSVSEEIILEFLRDSITALKSTIPSQEHSWERAHFILRDNGFSAQPTKRPHWEALDATLRDTEAALKIASVFEVDPLLLQYRRDWSPTTYQHVVCASLNSTYLSSMIVRDYLERVDGLVLSDEVALTVANGFMSSWRTGFTNLKLFAVVRDFTGTFDRVDFGDDIYLERMKYDAAVRFRERHQGLPWQRIGTPDGVPPNFYILCEEVRVGIGEAARTPLAYSKAMLRALTALRLKCSDVRDLGALCVDTFIPGQYCPWVGMSRQTPTEHFGMRPYSCVIDRDYAQSVIQLFSAIKKTYSENAFRIALERIDFGNTRTRAEDSFLDALITLEALFGSGAGEGVTYKIRMRCAVVIGSNVTERMNIAEEVTKLYALRSKVVHGRGRPPADFPQQARRAFELARLSVIRMLEMAELDINLITDVELDRLLLSS